LADDQSSLPAPHRKAKFFQLIRADWDHKRRWLRLDAGWKSCLYLIFCEGSLAHLLYRAMSFCHAHRLKLLSALIYRFNAVFCKTIIGREAQFGPGLVFLHGFGIVINSEVKAGEKVVLEHMITIGAERRQCPRLGNNIFIGTGAKVIGNIKVGNDIRIGANAVVVKDVPDGATVVGVPGRVVKIYGRRVGPVPRSICEGQESL
jgi:serine O-acetyltransferase